MTTAVEDAYRDLSPLQVRVQTHRRYSETDHDVEFAALPGGLWREPKGYVVITATA